MKTRIGNFENYGTKETADGMMFTFAVTKDGPCSIRLFSVCDFTPVATVELDESYCVGAVYSVVLIGKNWDRYCYLLSQNDETFVDPYARVIAGRNHWADESRFAQDCAVFGSFDTADYAWRFAAPQIAPADMILYKLHMRGFTCNHGMKASQKGNYRGIMEGLPYLQSMGVTSLEFQPIYEFEELMYETQQMISAQGEITDEIVSLDKTNYWGYGGAFYFAPKASYFGGKDAALHCREMIDAIHGAGMEVILEISFAVETSDDVMLDCLWHWVRDYHVDGFHLLGCNVPIERIAASKRLARTKIFYEFIPEEVLSRQTGRKHLFLYNDGFMHVARQIQNHMEGSMVQFTNHLRRQNDRYGFVNYLANTNGFTLWDSYCYGEKHNEANGEENRDGNNLNYSFNYGVEGPSRNRQIQQIRMQQMRNGLCMTLLAQAVPLICSGDEAANSQNGNNNVYCQDNAMGWVQFARTKSQKELLEFVTKLIAFRKAHPVLCAEHPMQLTDYKHVGIPDLSYHGTEPWLMEIGEEQKAVGVLYAGAYGGAEEENVFVAYNFHYHQVRLALPRTPGGREWQFVMNTANAYDASFEPMSMEQQGCLDVPEHSITILVS